MAGTPAGANWKRLLKELLNDRLRDERFPLMKPEWVLGLSSSVSSAARAAWKTV